MIKYHGGVLHTDALDLWEYAGRSFCVSWAYPQKLELYHEIGQSVMLDNGAFSAWTEGKAVDWNDYYRWCEPWLEYQTTWAIIPDVIDGDWRANDALIAEWPHGDKGAPVYHITGPLERLARLCEEWPLVCLGISSEQYGRINSPAWRKRMEQVMDVATDEHGLPRTRLHMLRGLAFCGGPYPLWSADSASVARSWSGSPRAGVAPKAVAKFYASFDGKNPPRRWVRPVEQPALFAAEPEPEVEFSADELDAGGPLGDPHALEARAAVPIQRNRANSAQGGLL